MTSASLQKQFYSTNSVWEARIGYYRAVRRGDMIWVSGTTSVDPASTASPPLVRFPGDAREQTRVVLNEIIEAIQAVGGRGAESIVRCRMFVNKQEDCGAVGEVFQEILGKGHGGQIGAAATMIVVPGGFVDDNMLVEIEADAFADGDNN
ncbi:YjgH family protein [Penicillium verhagenii]|uniref:YjgH family protein n=1 Tax=Penicillium verhagenii TaxID=1562060 RepID=UPI0025450107|nr:YjgH family protein [Penicillium verhagenii]KAJ5947656.1 YjgH family protein [Penicillium verhagenii]